MGGMHPAKFGMIEPGTGEGAEGSKPGGCAPSFDGFWKGSPPVGFGLVGIGFDRSNGLGLYHDSLVIFRSRGGVLIHDGGGCRIRICLVLIDNGRGSLIMICLVLIDDWFRSLIGFNGGLRVVTWIIEYIDRKGMLNRCIELIGYTDGD